LPQVADFSRDPMRLVLSSSFQDSFIQAPELARQLEKQGIDIDLLI
jgi:hypothetical protein